MYIKLPQNKLREKYHSYGHFYNLVVNDERIPCRSVLEIVEANSDLDNEVSPTHNIPDAIVIMMNPGGSQPDLTRINNYNEPQINDNSFEIDFRTKKLVRAVADTTQNRIMNVMNVMSWRHVRILNLTDIREANSSYLNSHVSRFSSAANSSIHSIFSSKRSKEIEVSLSEDIDSIFIFGWGTQDCLKSISKHAFEFITSNEDVRYAGIRQEGSLYNFYHPGRRKNWHEDVLSQIKLIETNS